MENAEFFHHLLFLFVPAFRVNPSFFGLDDKEYFINDESHLFYKYFV